MEKRIVLAILLVMNLASSNSCCLFGLSPTSCMPDLCTMLYSAFCDWLRPDSESSAYAESSQPEHPKYDKSSGSWTYDCPCIKGCEYGVDPGDADNCPQCLLGPGEICDNWSGECGDGLMCQYDGPIACSGKCISKDQFYSRKLYESCGEWDGECDTGLKCRYDEHDALLMPLYGCFMHTAGSCVTEDAFNTQGSGDICSDLIGQCAEGLQCQPPLMPFLPSTCAPVGEAPDDGLCQPTMFFHGPGQLGLEVAMMVEEDGDGGLVFEEVAIPVPEEEDNDLFSILEEESEDDIISEIIDAIEHAVPSILGDTDPETGEFQMVSFDDNVANDFPGPNIADVFSHLGETHHRHPSNDTTEDTTFELVTDDGNSLDINGEHEQPFHIEMIIDIEDSDGEEAPSILEFDIISDEPIQPEMLEGLLR